MMDMGQEQQPTMRLYQEFGTEVIQDWVDDAIEGKFKFFTPKEGDEVIFGTTVEGSHEKQVGEYMKDNGITGTPVDWSHEHIADAGSAYVFVDTSDGKAEISCNVLNMGSEAFRHNGRNREKTIGLLQRGFRAALEKGVIADFSLYDASTKITYGADTKRN